MHAPLNEACVPINNFMAGDESHARNPLIDDLILLGDKLAKLGFVYSKGKVTILSDYT
jgi:hypothetical protein